MADTPPRRQDTEYHAEMVPDSDEEEDNRTPAEVQEDAMKAMLRFYKQLPTKAQKDAHLRTYPVFKRWYKKYLQKQRGDNNERPPKRPRGPPPPDDGSVAPVVGMGKHSILNKLRALKQGCGQSTSRYKPAGYEPTKRDVNMGKFMFENPHLFIIPNDEITRDAVRKIEADIGVRIGHPEVDTRIKSLYGRIPKLAERLAWIGQNAEFRPNARAQLFKAEIEALQNRLMPIERIVEERVDPGDEPAVPGSFDFLDEEEKYEEPGLYEDPGVQDAAAAEPPASLQARFQDAQRVYLQIREHIPMEDRREAALLHAQISGAERAGSLSPDLMRRFVEQVNKLLGPGVGSGKSGGSAEPQQHALHTPPLRGGSAEPQQHALHTPPLAFRFGKKREYLEGGNYY
jgi:hypothetical protein